jgi:hypothetical protein
MTFSAWVNKWIFQMAHVGWGLAIALFMGAMLGPMWGGISNAGQSAVKEFIFDPLTETPGLSGGIKGDALDFLFWNVGGAVGTVLAIIVRHHLGQ